MSFLPPPGPGGGPLPPPNQPNQPPNQPGQPGQPGQPWSGQAPQPVPQPGGQPAAQPYGAPPPQTWQTPVPGFGADVPPKKSNTAKIVAAIIVVLALAGGGIYVLTRKDDKKSVTEATDVTEDTSGSDSDSTDVTEPDTEATVAATEATEATEPPTTEAAPTTEATTVDTTQDTSEATVPASDVPTSDVPTTDATPTTAPVTPPANAIQLGYSVYIPLPDGWTDKVSGKVHTLSGTAGDTDKIGVQVVARTPGEAPSAVFNEYIQGFVNDAAAISFSPSLLRSVSGAVVAYEYGTYYTQYDETKDDGIGLVGAVYVFQRSDGLTAIYDTYGTDDTMGVPDAEFNEFVDSYDRAPIVTTPTDLQPADPFRVTTPVAPLVVSGNTAFSLAPGFTEVTSGGGRARATSGQLDFTVDALGAQTGLDTSLATAEANTSAEFAGATFGDVQPFDDYSGLNHEGITWDGTVADGTAWTGTIDIYFDPNTQHGLAITRAWPVAGNETEPNAVQEGFMYRSIEDDIAAEGIPAT